VFSNKLLLLHPLIFNINNTRKVLENKKKKNKVHHTLQDRYQQANQEMKKVSITTPHHHPDHPHLLPRTKHHISHPLLLDLHQPV
jgi:hypothetical protein